MTILLTVGLTATVLAQPGGNGNSPHRRQFSPEAFKQELQNFITKEAQLNEKESKDLFPILFEMLSKKRANQKERMQLMHSVKPETTDAQYATIIDKVTTLDIEDKRIEKEYYKKFQKVLSNKKVFQVRIALDRFQMEALRKFQRKGGNGGRPSQQKGGGSVPSKK